MFRLKVFILCIICVNCQSLSEEDSQTLQLVHVIFRHGDRTNDQYTTYPKDPYINETYPPYGPGQLTNKGKRTTYKLGQAIRERYNDFLGKAFYPGIVEAWSSNWDRTKMSLLMVLAGLFPPTAEDAWDRGVSWQPVPFNQLPVQLDKILLSYVSCPNYTKLYKEFIHSAKVVEEMKQHRELFEYLSEHTGLNVTDYSKVFTISGCLMTEEQLGLTLPPWTRKIYPHPIKDLAPREYLMQTATTPMRTVLAGYLLEKIIKDTKTKLTDNGSHTEKKIILYSGHEINVAHLLCTLDIFDPIHIPPYGAYVLVEIHKINGVYGIKIFYENYTTSEPQALKLPGCEQFCEFDKFISLVQKYLPTENSCGSETICHY